MGRGWQRLAEVGREAVFHPRKMGCPAGTGQSGKPSQCIDDRSAIKAKPDVDLQDLKQTGLKKMESALSL